MKHLTLRLVLSVKQNLKAIFGGNALRVQNVHKLEWKSSMLVEKGYEPDPFDVTHTHLKGSFGR